MADMVNHPPHYSAARFGVECIAFTELMPFCAGNAFKYVWRCEDKGSPVQDLEKALWYWARAACSGQPSTLLDHSFELVALYWSHIHPKVETDWMAAVLGHMLWENWTEAGNGIEARRAFFFANGGQP